MSTDLDDAFAAIICPKHGLVYITEAEYERQMRLPNANWRCPVMVIDHPLTGECGETCEWDDEFFDTKPNDCQEWPKQGDAWSGGFADNH